MNGDRAKAAAKNHCHPEERSDEGSPMLRVPWGILRAVGPQDDSEKAARFLPKRLTGDGSG
jgi:hypothetical protein